MQNEIDSSNIIAALVKDDLVSIDAFRCSFVHHVTMEKHQLVISNLQEIQGRLNKLLPSKEITEIIVNISKENHK